MERLGLCRQSSAWHQSNAWLLHVKRRCWRILALLLAGILSWWSLAGSGFDLWHPIAQRRRRTHRCIVHPGRVGHMDSAGFDGLWQRV